MSVPFGILVHLGSEFAALGRDADDVAFSPLHAYLAVFAIAAFAVFLFAGGFFRGSCERRRRMSLLAHALPWNGRGPLFFAFSAALQFGFFVVTQFGEGCPLCGGDAAVGIAAALFASIAGAFLLNRLRARIVRVVIALCEYLDRVKTRPRSRRVARYFLEFVPASFAAYPVVNANRPPPLSLLNEVFQIFRL